MFALFTVPGCRYVCRAAAFTGAVFGFAPSVSRGVNAVNGYGLAAPHTLEMCSAPLWRRFASVILAHPFWFIKKTVLCSWLYIRTLANVARRAEQLKIDRLVAAAARFWNDVVDLEGFNSESFSTLRTFAALPIKQRTLPSFAALFVPNRVWGQSGSLGFTPPIQGSLITLVAGLAGGLAFARFPLAANDALAGRDSSLPLEFLSVFVQHVGRYYRRCVDFSLATLLHCICPYGTMYLSESQFSSKREQNK